MNKQRLLNAALTIVLLISLVGALPAAARPLAGIAADGTLRVGMTGDYAPFAVRSPEMVQIAGADVIMAESLAKALGVALVVVPARPGKPLPPTLRQTGYDIAAWAG